MNRIRTAKLIERVWWNSFVGVSYEKRLFKTHSFLRILSSIGYIPSRYISYREFGKWIRSI